MEVRLRCHIHRYLGQRFVNSQPCKVALLGRSLIVVSVRPEAWEGGADSVSLIDPKVALLCCFRVFGGIGVWVGAEK